jgi:hypothetical protein
VSDTATVQAGADQAAAELAAKLEAAGWRVRLYAADGQPRRFSDGSLMISTTRQTALHADGPHAIRYANLAAYWYTVIDAKEVEHVGDIQFNGAEISIGGTDRELKTEAEMNAWLDALIAVAAALDA